MKEFCVKELVTLIDRLASFEEDLKGVEVDAEIVAGHMYETLRTCGPVLDQLGLTIAHNLALRLKRSLANEDNTKPVVELANAVRAAIWDGMESIECLRIERGPGEFLSKYSVLENYVQERFPTAVAEMREAARCLSFGQGTACVFHVTRAMETVLKAAFKALGFPGSPDTWGRKLAPFNEQIALSPDKKTVKWREGDRFYSRLAAEIGAAKSSYRDDTVHVASTYSPADAEVIFNLAAATIRHAAEHLHQDDDMYLPLPPGLAPCS